MRTEAEIASIARYRGDITWITNLQNAGEHDEVEAMFTHHKNHDLIVISNCVGVIKDMDREHQRDLLTTEMLDRMTVICVDLDNHDASTWNPDEFRALSGYFIQNFDQWPTAMDIIRYRNATTFKEVLGLLHQSLETEKPLLSGVL